MTEPKPTVCSLCDEKFEPRQLTKHTIISKVIRCFWLCADCSKEWMKP